MSFITNYLKMVEGTEPPLAFHQWACVYTLSVLAGRRFWLNLGPIRYYTNLYVILVGKPGVKKSSAMERGKDIIREVRCCPVAASQVTKEFLTQAMSNEKFPGRKFYQENGRMVEYNQYAIFATELTQFIAVNPLGMLDFLTTVYTEKVYDCDTKGKGSDFINGPYITMLACMTPEIVKGYLKMNILTGGFARRTIFCYGVSGSIVPFPTFTDEQRDCFRACVEYGRALQSKSGEFVMSQDARDWYEAWYIDLKKNRARIKPCTEGYFETKHELLFKVSMLLALSEDGLTGNLVLEPEHFLLAERFFAVIERNLERVFEGSGINPNSQAASQICRMIEELPEPISRKKLEAMFYDNVTSLNELRDMITFMVNVGKFSERTVQVNGNLIGSVIAMSDVMAKYTDSELAAILQRKILPPIETE